MEARFRFAMYYTGETELTRMSFLGLSVRGEFDEDPIYTNLILFEKQKIVKGTGTQGCDCLLISLQGTIDRSEMEGFLKYSEDTLTYQSQSTGFDYCAVRQRLERCCVSCII